MLTTLIAQASRDVFGRISPPPGVSNFGGNDSGSGLIIFVSNIIRLATVVAGVWVLLNFVLAGYDYVVSNGDSGAHKKVNDRLTMSVIGLLIIATAYTSAALIGLLIFGDAGFILNPVICGPRGC